LNNSKEYPMAHHSNSSNELNQPFGTFEAPAPKYKRFTTRSLYIPLRDGVKLALDVTLPKGLDPDKKIPTLLSQTRYWRQMELRAPFKWFMDPNSLLRDYKDFNPFFSSHGYAIVGVDVRGTGASTGICPYPWALDSVEDMTEIVDWIISQPWSNGKVGGYGISYVGTTAELLATINHPAVKAVIPMFNHPDAYTDIAFPGGVLNKRFIQEWGHFDNVLDRNEIPGEFGLLGRLVIKGVKPVDSDQNRRLLTEAVRDHGSNGNVYDMAQVLFCRDQYDEKTGVCVDDITIARYKEQLKGSQTAIFSWGSWMDGGTADAVIRRFLTYDQAYKAVIGAWEHGGRYHASPYQGPDLPADPKVPEQWLEMLGFFDTHLQGSPEEIVSERTLYYFTMGEEKWKATQVWPVEDTQNECWYLADKKTLSQDKPTVESGSDDYTVDFEASTSNQNRWFSMNGVYDQTVVYPERSLQNKHLLSYTTHPFKADTEITGYPVVTLFVASTETDGALYVYLEDVEPDGRVTYITEGQLRLIHRKISTEIPPYKLQIPYHSFKSADVMPMLPGEVSEIAFGLLPTSVLIKEGHCIRVSIAGHDEGTFVRIPESGIPVMTVFRNKIHPSSIDLPVIHRKT
jgi:putative CocE/NonD family hydrolase